MVALEDLEEARLRAGRSLHAAEGKRAAAVIDILDIEHQVLHPERGALADRRELRGLKVRVAERRLVAPLLGERRQRAKHVERAAAKQIQPATHQNEIGVVGDVGAGGAQMDERLCLRRDVAEGMHVRHHVVTETVLVTGDRIEVDVVEIRRASGRSLRRGSARRALFPLRRARATGGAKVRNACAATTAPASLWTRNAPRAARSRRRASVTESRIRWCTPGLRARSGSWMTIASVCVEDLLDRLRVGDRCAVDLHYDVARLETPLGSDDPSLSRGDAANLPLAANRRRDCDQLEPAQHRYTRSIDVPQIGDIGRPTVFRARCAGR